MCSSYTVRPSIGTCDSKIFEDHQLIAPTHPVRLIVRLENHRGLRISTRAVRGRFSLALNGFLIYIAENELFCRCTATAKAGIAKFAAMEGKAAVQAQRVRSPDCTFWPFTLTRTHGKPTKCSKHSNGLFGSIRQEVGMTKAGTHSNATRHLRTLWISFYIQLALHILCALSLSFSLAPTSAMGDKRQPFSSMFLSPPCILILSQNTTLAATKFSGLNSKFNWVETEN